MCQEDATQNKANKLLASLQNIIKVEDKQKNRVEVKPYIYSAIL